MRSPIRWRWKGPPGVPLEKWNIAERIEASLLDRAQDLMIEVADFYTRALVQRKERSTVFPEFRPRPL